MKTNFVPIDYDYFDWQGRNYVKIIGRDEKGKRICVVDTCSVYFWAILKDGLNEAKLKKIIGKIEKIKLNVKGRETKVEKVELHNKNFLGRPVKALKIFATNYKDLHDLASELGMKGIRKRRGYDLGFVTHYIIEKKIVPMHWYEVSGELLDNTDKFGGIGIHLDVGMCIELEKFEEIDEKKFHPKFLAYDIETDELKIGEGEILMISLVSDNFKKVLTWKKTSHSKQDYVEYVKDEAELLEKFVEYVRKVSPDFLVGYFSDGFDLPYLKARAEKHRVKLSLSLDDTQPKFSRGIEMTGKTRGIVHLDILKFIRTAYSQYMQSETLSLNEVANEFLGERKKSFEFKHSSKMGDDDWNLYYEYNLHDSVLVFKLFEKMWPDILEFSKIMQEPIAEVSRNGMSKNVESYILHNLEKFNEIPEKRPSHDEISERRMKGKYEGAFVFEPIPGMYEDIGMFDFTASYGSTIVTFNLSRSTFLEEPEKNSYSIETMGRKLYFMKKPGFFPEMLKDLIEKRKQFKKELKQEPDVIKKARSNAFKLLTNAAYGYQGFFGARYYSYESAAATAAFAKKAIKDVILKIDKKGYKIIYGDSVDGETKLLIRKNGKVYEEKIKNLFKKIDQKSSFGKEYNFKENMEVLTLDEKGNSVFKPITYVMRHNCDKKMYRVNFTNNWNIDVTEDHSLIGYQSVHFNQTKEVKENPLKRMIELKPNEIRKEANSIISLKKIPLVDEKSKNYPKEVYEFMGFFIGDGSFVRNKSHINRNKDYYLRLSLGSDSEEVFNKLIRPLVKLNYLRNHWFSRTRKGDVTLNGLRLVRIISENCRNENNRKVIPEWLFEESEENIASFLRGLFSADGTVMMRNKAPIIKYTSISDDYIKSVRMLLYRVGVSHSVFKDNSVNQYKTKKKVYSTGSFSKNIIIKDKEMFQSKIGFFLDRKNLRANIKTKSLKKKLIQNFEFDLQGVKKIERIKAPSYIYDVEVEDNHKFFANYVLVHNTDSIAFLLNGKTEKQTLEFLDELNSKLPGIMELELEDFFKRGLWVTKRSGTAGAKKKYALIDKNGRVKIRGFETVRRDWCALARKVQNHIIRLILNKGNEKEALIYVMDVVKKIKFREIKKSELIIKTQLKKPLSEYKAISPHVVAARKMQQAKIPISQGDLVEYYIAETNEKKKLVRDRVKLLEEEGKYDIEYYLKNQILPAVENIFQVFNIDINELINSKNQGKLNKWF